MRYPGGKQLVFRRIINLMPPHRTYVESHLGGGAVLRAKRPARLNIGIDRDERVLRAFRGYGSGYRFVCGSAVQVLKELKLGREALVYCDPPYPLATRRSRRSPYRFDLTDDDHRELLGVLRQLKCAVIVSSYPNDLYARALADWQAVEVPGASHAGGRTEMLWMNFTPGGVLHDPRFVGDEFRQREAITRRRRRWLARLRKMSKPEQQAMIGSLLSAFGDGLSPREARGAREQFVQSLLPATSKRPRTSGFLRLPSPDLVP